MGDLTRGYAHGVVIVPNAHAPEVLWIAVDFAETEEGIKDAISQGENPVEALQCVSCDRM